MTVYAETPHDALGGRYDMSPEELQQSAELFLHQNPPRENSGRFACYRIEGDSPFADIGRTIECTVFSEAFGNDAETMRRAYGPYEHASRFYVNFDIESGRPVGALRRIENSEAGLMTINDLASGTAMTDAKTGQPIQRSIESVLSFYNEASGRSKKGNPFSLDRCWDVGTVAVLPEYRGGATSASAQLYSSLYVDSLEAGIEHWTSVIDAGPYRQLTRFIGVPFEPLANTPEVNYLDSPKSRVAYAHVPDVYRAVDGHRKTPFGRMAGPLIERILDGEHGFDESLQFFSVEQLKDIRAKAREEASRGRSGMHSRSIGRRILSVFAGR